jgi:molybdopterin converting factor small subunit
MIYVWIHSNIARLADNKMNWEFHPKKSETSLFEVLNSTLFAHPNLLFGIIDETGLVRRHINVYVDNIDIKKLNNLQTLLKDNCEVSVFTAVSGG